MKDAFKYNEVPANDPVRIEQVYAEKPGGGVVVEPGFDAPETTAVGVLSSGKFGVIKGYRLIEAVAVADTTISIEKGSGVAKNDVIAYGKKGVKCTAVNTTDANKDVVTVTMGMVIPVGTVLYQAKEASTEASEGVEAKDAEPLYKPKYVTGNKIFAGKGDQPVRLINGANLRKETANIGEDIAALLSNIELV